MVRTPGPALRPRARRRAAQRPAARDLAVTPEQLADIHAQAMEFPAPWSADDFADLLDTKGVFIASTTETGFALGRIIQDEAELLTLAILPNHQRQGLGLACLSVFEREAQRRGAALAHLEVAQTNLAARALYERHNWRETGLRRGYFRSAKGRIDAILMQKHLTPA